MSGCVGAGAKLIPGPANLHELHRINSQTGSSQIIQDVKGSGQKPLLPVFIKLADDVFDVIFINQEIVLHDGFHILFFYCTVQDLLLVMEWDL